VYQAFRSTLASEFKVILKWGHVWPTVESNNLRRNGIVIYGIEIDSEAMVARLPQGKIDKILGLLKIFKVRRKVTLRELQSLLDLLNFACSVIMPGRAFLRRLFDSTVGHTCPHFRITLNSEARVDLKAWYTFICNNFSLW
jgi:hypothetical protein